MTHLQTVLLFKDSSGDSYEIVSATGDESGEFSRILDTANTAELSRLDIYGPNGLLVSYLPPGLGVFNLHTLTPLPASLSSGNLNAFLVPLLDPTAEQFSSLYEISFSNANMQRFNIEGRFDDLAAGSTGFVSKLVCATDIPNSPTKVSGPSLGHDSAVINAGLSVQWNRHLATYVSYDGQLGRSRYNSNGVRGGFRYAF